MLPFSNVQEYIALYPQHKTKLQQLVTLFKSSELEETIKWKLPVYCLKNKNVVGLGAFKEHISLWFFQGALLKDTYQVLENAQAGKTKAMLHWKFGINDEIDFGRVKEYLAEAIENQKQGRTVPVKRTKTTSAEIVIPDLLRDALQENGLAAKFSGLTPYKQKECINYILEAKRETTKLKRLEKLLPLIAEGKSINDQYR